MHLFRDFTQCAECQSMVHVDVVFKKRYFNGKLWQEEHFCNETCHREWLVKRLRKAGL